MRPRARRNIQRGIRRSVVPDFESNAQRKTDTFTSFESTDYTETTVFAVVGMRYSSAAVFLLILSVTVRPLDSEELDAQARSLRTGVRTCTVVCTKQFVGNVGGDDGCLRQSAEPAAYAGSEWKCDVRETRRRQA